MIDPARVQQLSDRTSGRKPRYVLYWMQSSQRVVCNHALEYAIDRANELNLPPVVCFGLIDSYPEANARHYAFMLQGLRDVAEDRQERGIRFVLRRAESPADAALSLARDAAIVVCDRGYLRVQKRWYDAIADAAPCPVFQVESNVVVPVETASDAQEFVR